MNAGAYPSLPSPRRRKPASGAAEAVAAAPVAQPVRVPLARENKRSPRRRGCLIFGGASLTALSLSLAHHMSDGDASMSHADGDNLVTRTTPGADTFAALADAQFDDLFSQAARLIPSTAPADAAEVIAAAATKREPVVWTRSFASDWRAHRVWDIASLQERLPWLVARAQAEGEFVLTAPQRGNSAPLLQGAPAWEPLRPEMRNISVETLLTASPASGHSSSSYYYYSGTLHDAATEHWATAQLLSELEPTAPLHLEDAPPLLPDDGVVPPTAASLAANRTSLRLWLTSDRVLARTHYDKGHNLLCVVRGQKRVLLWPPEELPSLHLYPAVHAGHRQSQVSLLRLTHVSAALASGAPPRALGALGEFDLVDARSLLGRRGARSVELDAGSMLYIPPYWAHAVYSSTPSVALAAFSTSWEQARWARAAWHAAPLGRFAAGGLCSKARGAAMVIAEFLHASAPTLGGTPREILAHLYAARFAPLYGALHAPSRATDASTSLAECLGAAARALPPGAPERDVALHHRMAQYASTVAALLVEPDRSADGRVFARGVAVELAGDYVEEMAGWAVGADGTWRLIRQLALAEELDDEIGRAPEPR